MSDLGMTLAWLAVRVSIVLAAVVAVHALASRRGAAQGAWVASLGLGLVVVLSVAAFVPRSGLGDRWAVRVAASVRNPLPPAIAESPIPISSESESKGEDGTPTGAGGTTFLEFRLALDRLGNGAAAPLERVRPWGGLLAIIALLGTGVGLLRLAVGLGAVALCRRRGILIDDPEMAALLAALRDAMGCRRTVELREAADLDGPATAGWRRPVILLPDDWRMWGDAERRAVLAHELAHIVRGDYAVGLLARLATSLHGYHSLVRWLAGRLHFQQELAADALGARFAGGRASYLVALSRLALRQDGRSPYRPARAFLPAPGTLIRRIEMLRNESNAKSVDRTWSGARKFLTTCGLLALTMGVAALRGPALGGEEPPNRPASASAPEPDANAKADPAAPLHLREGMDGVLVIRPAAIFRREGMGRLVPLLRTLIDAEFGEIARELDVDTAKPGFLKLNPQDIEWITAGIGFGRGQKSDEGRELHSLMLANPSIRMAVPFDWPAFLRQWRLDLEEVRVGERSYYRLSGPTQPLLGPAACVYLPDDRTLVLDSEEAIHKLAAGKAPTTPNYLRGSDWEEACRGLLAVAIGNEDDSFVKH